MNGTMKVAVMEGIGKMGYMTAPYMTVLFAVSTRDAETGVQKFSSISLPLHSHSESSGVAEAFFAISLAS